MAAAAMRAFTALVLVVGLVACASPTGLKAGLKVSQEEFGGRWPFTVLDGTLACEKGAWYTFEHDGTKYALNGAADSVSELQGYSDLDPIWKPDLTPIAGAPIPGKRMNLTEMLDLAGQQCSEDQ